MIENLLSTMASHQPSFDTGLVRRAYAFGLAAHGDMRRLTGEPFIVHPVSVAEILSDIGMDDVTIAAALLHDVVEDCDVGLDSLRKEFGDEVAKLVEGVTNLTRFDFTTRQEEQAENLRRLFLAMAKDIRVIIIKLADRLHNLRTLEPFTEEQQKEKAEETLHIFAPLAHRLGIWHLKWELEDLSFRYTNPEIYWDMVRKVKKTREQRVHEVDKAVAMLQSRLADENIDAEIQGRPKHLYSIYMKMLRDELDFDRIYDLTAIRVICESVRRCYHALGMVHSLWMPIQGMYTDYIAKAKANGYQSLHTKVYGPDGEPMEVQIRTWAMHRESEFGVAAHWRYKENGDATDGGEAAKSARWIQQFLELQHEHPDSSEYLDSLKIDLFEDQVFAFTPQGDVLELPAGSSPVDFAYRIHSEVGHQCIGAKVNGRIAPLNHRLSNGDIVEILTQKTSRGPSRGWLDFTQTPHARGRIKSFLRKASFDENLHTGRERLEREAQANHLDPKELLRTSVLEEISQHTNFRGANNLVAAVGFGDVSSESVIEKCRQQLYGGKGEQPRKPQSTAARRKRAQAEQGRLRLGIASSDIDNVLYRLSKCCCPLPGDKVVGYITRGRGVAVHREDCRNIQYYTQKDPDRIVEIEWSLPGEADYQMVIRVEAFDRVGLLNDITGMISEKDMNIESASARIGKNQMARLKLVLCTKKPAALDALMREIENLTDVTRVYRVTG